MNILVLSDKKEILERAKPIFQKRNFHHWIFTNSYDINPKKDFKHIIDNYDLVFSLHCKTIFPKVLTDSIRCINIHPGFNPYNRGIFPHVFSIVNGLPAGATIHEMNEVIDDGPIIIRKKVDVKESDTSSTLYERIVECELELLEDSIDHIINNQYIGWVDLDDAYGEPSNYNSMEDFKRLCDFGDISWIPQPDLERLFNRLRALSHTGYMNAHYNGIRFKLIIDHTTHSHNENHTQTKQET